jgi:pimeloyl-[acyl-carrier protein] methyl ester esterase
MDVVAQSGGQRIEAIAYHGWGFDRHCWEPWVQRFATIGVTLRAADRGYFGAEQSWEFGPASYNILVTHSYGLHWCPAAQRRSADLLICLAGFAAFHPEEGAAGRRSRRLMARMLAAFETEPAAVLEEFWRNCLDPEADRDIEDSSLTRPNLAMADWALLDRDLRHLDRCQLDPQVPLPRRSIIVHGSADRIVPLQQGQFLAELSQAHWIELADSSHGFPVCDLDRTWAAIEPLLRSFLDSP